MGFSRETWEWIRSIVVAVVLALLIRFFVIEVFVVDGKSMYPTLDDSNRLIVDKISYRFHEPQHGDIVVFDSRTGRDFIKRVIGVGGDTIEIRAGKVYRNGIPLDEPYLMGQTDYQDYGPVEIPPGHFFLMGDFRRDSMDSRDPRIGLVSLDRIKGRAFLVFWPPAEAKILAGGASAN
jgi:signal peptidase I